MNALSKTELRIIRDMLVKQYGEHPPLLSQLAAASIINREFTGCGVYINLRVPPDTPPVDHLNAEISEGYRTIFAEPRDLVGFTLFIRNGYIKFLEGYTFGGGVEWPGELSDDWLASRPVAVEKQKAR